MKTNTHPNLGLLFFAIIVSGILTSCTTPSPVIEIPINSAPAQPDAAHQLASQSVKNWPAEAIWQDGQLIFHGFCSHAQPKVKDCTHKVESLDSDQFLALLDDELKHRRRSLQWLETQKLGNRLPAPSPIQIASNQTLSDYAFTKEYLDSINALRIEIRSSKKGVRMLGVFRDFSDSSLKSQILSDLFTRLLVQVKDSAGKVWRFAGNDHLYFGSADRCSKLFPGSRLPISADTGDNIEPLNVLSDHLKVHYLDHHDALLRSFWSAELPGDLELRQHFDQVEDIDQRAWAIALADLNYAGQLVLMTSRSSLLCVHEP